MTPGRSIPVTAVPHPPAGGDRAEGRSSDPRQPPRGRPRAGLLLTLLLGAAALATVVIGAWQPVDLPADGPPLTGRLGIAAVLAAAAQVARVRVRLGVRSVSIAWGESAFILGFAVLPAGWLPAATCVGAIAGGLLLSARGDRRPAVEIVHSAASLILAVAAAAAVTTQLAGPGDTRLDGARMQVDLLGPGGSPLTSALGLALLAGCGVFLLVTTGLTTLTLATYADVPHGLTVARALRGMFPVFVGNVAVSLLALLAIGLEPALLLLLPVAVWLLRRGHRAHLRADEQRRAWLALGRAVHTFVAAPEPEVPIVGVRGALEVFGAHRVRIRIMQFDGTHRCFEGVGGGSVTELAPADVEPPDGVAPQARRALATAEATLGELAIWVTPWTNHDEAVLDAYGDALASALHGTATRRELADTQARAAYDATHDPLTGLGNRAELISRGDRILRALDCGEPVALLLVDLTGFQRVNSTLGHAAGDELLRVLGRRIADLSREHDLVARTGDDEFAVLVPAMSVLSDSNALSVDPPPALPAALRRAQELLELLRAPAEIAGLVLTTEAAVGVVVATAGAGDLAELIRRAEIALHEAKLSEAGLTAYDDTLDTSSTDHLALLAELRQALDADDEITVALQPAVDLQTGTPTGVEALSRWRHPRRGPLAPTEFIRVVEHSELLGRFTGYILDRSLAAAADWSAGGLELPVSVNVAARTLLDPGFPDQVADALRRHGVPAHQLVLEITETVAVSDQPIVDEVVAALRDLGVQLSVDDFGTGYSSLAFLHRMPVDELKVDRSFVAGMGRSARSEAIVRFAVELGRRLDLRVVAEGVETAEQRAALHELGCTSAQGYHFCRPLPPDKIVEALRSLGEGRPARIRPLRADDAS